MLSGSAGKPSTSMELIEHEGVGSERETVTRRLREIVSRPLAPYTRPSAPVPRPLKFVPNFNYSSRANTNVNFSGTNVAVELPSWLGRERLSSELEIREAS